MNIYDTREGVRLVMNQQRKGHWNRWGPFLSERAWGTVREDYSADGNAWCYFPHDHARSRAYRWNEDGLAGLCDRHQYLCFALALWNGRDPILSAIINQPRFLHTLRPRWHAEKHHVSQTPHAIGQSGCHRRYTGPPSFGRARAMSGNWIH